MKKQTFSIIMPVYKDAYKTIGRAVYSLQDQDFENWELAIVFDGENKKGIKALKKGFNLETHGKKYTIKPLKDKRIKYYVKPWGGAADTRNYGVRKTSGEYIALIDPDVYLYPGTLREWFGELENDKDIDFVYGHYDIVGGEQILAREFSRKALESTNYISGAFPIRRSVWEDQRKGLKALQDWDMWLTLTDKGCKGKFIDKSFFITEPPGEISKYSHTHWKELTSKIRKWHNIPKSDLVVCSLGAEWHAINTAEILGSDVLPIVSLKPHNYRTIYLLGFYPSAVKAHIGMFMNDFRSFMAGGSVDGKPIKRADATKIIHWIGTDIFQMKTIVSFDSLQGLKRLFEDFGIIHLTEAKHTQAEMKELGIKTKVVPLPPNKLFRWKQFKQPKKFVVANYINPTQSEMYKEEFMKDVADHMPDVEFMFFGDKNKVYKENNCNYVGWKPIEWIIKNSSILTRMVVHDGLPHSPLQFLTAGRRVISNVKIKYFDYCPVDRKAVIEKIRKLKKNPIAPKKASDFWRKELDHKKFKKRIENLVKEPYAKRKRNTKKKTRS